MEWERITRVMETLYGSFVFAQQHTETGETRVVCSGCEAFADVLYRTRIKAMFTAGDHAVEASH
jgi:hypothetical protein